MWGWTEREYDAIFRDHPPTQPTAPTGAACSRLGRELDRSPGAVRAQWDEGRALVLGQTTDASRGLRHYLVRRGWL